MLVLPRTRTVLALGPCPRASFPESPRYSSWKFPRGATGVKPHLWFWVGRVVVAFWPAATRPYPWKFSRVSCESSREHPGVLPFCPWAFVPGCLVYTSRVLPWLSCVPPGSSLVVSPIPGPRSPPGPFLPWDPLPVRTGPSGTLVLAPRLPALGVPPGTGSGLYLDCSR